MRNLKLITGIAGCMIYSCLQAETEIKFDTLSLIDGRKYSDAKVTKVELDALTVMHSGGIARIPFENLPILIQEKFGYDPEAAKLAREQFVQEKTAQQAEMAAQADRKAKLDAEAQKKLEDISSFMEVAKRSAEQDERLAAELDAKTFAMTCEVSRVLENGILVWQPEWMDEKNNRLRQGEDFQLIEIKEIDQLELYEGLRFNIVVEENGVANYGDRKFKAWRYVPGVEKNRYPSDFGR